MKGRIFAVRLAGMAPNGKSAKRILVIDDDAGIRDILQRFLIKKGFDVELAGAGRQGIDKFHAGHFDLVITDIHLPGCAGVEIIREIRCFDPKVGILAVSGAAAPVEINEVLARGAAKFIPKPFGLAPLLREITRLL